MSTTPIDRATDSNPAQDVQTEDMSPRLLKVRTRIPASMPSRLLHRNLLKALVCSARTCLRISLRVEGSERLDGVKGPFIIAPNHVSLLDSPLIHVELPARHARHTAVVGGLDFFAPRNDRPLRENLWRRMVVRFIRGAVNTALIDRSGGDYSNLEQLDDLLSRGWNLVIFPEATRSRSGTLGRMKLGVPELARRYDCPVLPTHIEGTNDVLPVGSSFPRRGRIRIRIGQPMRIETGENSRVFIERLRREIVALGPEGSDS